MLNKDREDIQSNELMDESMDVCTTDIETLAMAESAEANVEDNTEVGFDESTETGVDVGLDASTEPTAEELTPSHTQEKRERKSIKKKLVITLVSIFACLSIMVCVIVPTIYEHGILNVHNLKSAKDGQIRVACVGDSITYGCMVSNWTKNNYPTQLGNMLGGGYCVNKFGYS